MPLRFTNRILDHLQHSQYRPSASKAIARDLNVEADEHPIFDEAIEMLAAEARIEIGRDELVRLPGYPEEVTGVFRLNQRGFGFVIPDTAYRDGDLFVPRGATVTRFPAIACAPKSFGDRGAASLAPGAVHSPAKSLKYSSAGAIISSVRCLNEVGNGSLSRMADRSIRRC